MVYAIFQFQFVDGVKSNRGSGIGIDLDLGVPAGVGLNKSSDGSSDGTGKLVHLTASRVKAPKRRPPSQAFLKDVVCIPAFFDCLRTNKFPCNIIVYFKLRHQTTESSFVRFSSLT